MTHTGSSTPRPGRLLPICLLALCSLIPGLASADVYKWTDDGGKINYTQMPPPSGYEAELIREAYSPPETSRPVESPPSSLETRIIEEQEDKESAAEREKRDKENAEIRRLNCDAATRNLVALEQNSQRAYKTANGEILRPTDAERKKLIETTKEQIKKHCGN